MMFKGFFRVAAIILFSALCVCAQTAARTPAPSEFKTLDQSHKQREQEDEFQVDMRVKMAIARAEDDHKKLLEDVEKLNNLSCEVAKNYGEHKRFSPDEIKKLSTIEKLARHVLSQSGGDEVDPKYDHLKISEAVEKLTSVSAKIKKEMTAETRFIVSATVIANSNEVIGLARFIRQQKAE